MKKNITEIKERFEKEKAECFSDESLRLEGFKFSKKFTAIVESVINEFTENNEFDFAIVAAGGFCRKELSPLSDIDVMFIIPDKSDRSDEISEIITSLWDVGIEISHTVRSISDIDKFFNEDLHAVTQFFETRFIAGKKSMYDNWSKILFEYFDDVHRNKLLRRFFEDIKFRHNKYGGSPKVLEPNIKFTAGGLRDIQAVQWIYSVLNNVNCIISEDNNATETFLKLFEQENLIHPREIERIRTSYGKILAVRNNLHLLTNSYNDRFEFSMQEKVAVIFGYAKNDWQDFMREYFNSTSVINRYTKTMIKRFQEKVTNPLPEQLAIELDTQLILKGNVISINKNDEHLSLSEILRAFYYRGTYEARFEENLRSRIIESIESFIGDNEFKYKSSVFFREIFKLEKNVARTLTVMNELGFLSTYIPEFRELVGFFQPGVYHCYTADEHTLIAIQNLEDLIGTDTRLGLLFNDLLEKDLLYLSVFLHDIAKPISISGHEIIGSEVTSSIMNRIGYSQKEIDLVQFLVKNHLLMEQVAFRRNLDDPATLNNFTSIFPSIKALDMLYLLTFADLSAVAPVVWTQWKNDQLFELYRKARAMLVDELSGEELLYQKTIRVLKRAGTEGETREHLESINDAGYVNQFTEDEIDRHVKEIQKGSMLSVFFKVDAGYTNVTAISKDSQSILSKFCGVLSINDCNIHDARIFTRKDGVIIDSFNITDFRTRKPLEFSKYAKIEKDFRQCIYGQLKIGNEFLQLQSRWKRLENKFFRRKPKIKIRFEEHEKYTIIDIAAPDKVGLLYTITTRMHDLGLNIYFAKISTKADDVIDSFYTLDSDGNKISHHSYEFLRLEITDAISELF